MGTHTPITSATNQIGNNQGECQRQQQQQQSSQNKITRSNNSAIITIITTNCQGLETF